MRRSAIELRWSFVRRASIHIRLPPLPTNRRNTNGKRTVESDKTECEKPQFVRGSDLNAFQAMIVTVVEPEMCEW